MPNDFVMQWYAAQQWHEPDLLLAALVASGLCPPLGADGMNFEKDNVWLLGQVAWRGMLPAQVTFGR